MKMIPDWEANTVLISDALRMRHPEIVRQLEIVLRDQDIPLLAVPDMADIWIRDAAPVQVDQERFIQFRYRPDYLKGYEHLITESDVFRKMDFFRASEPAGIVLDGGNIVGTRSVAILTDKIYRENPSWNRNDLRSEIQRRLQVERLIVIPKEPYDRIGHADGMVRFLDDQTVIVNDYREMDVQFADRLDAILTRNALQIIRFPFVPVSEIRDGIHSAVGNFVNFLRVKDLFIIPVYGLPEDEIARSVLENQVVGGQVISLACRELAEEGGVLNCATWTGFVL